MRLGEAQGRPWTAAEARSVPGAVRVLWRDLRSVPARLPMKGKA